EYLDDSYEYKFTSSPLFRDDKLRIFYLLDLCLLNTALNNVRYYNSFFSFKKNFIDKTNDSRLRSVAQIWTISLDLIAMKNLITLFKKIISLIDTVFKVKLDN
ncbi:hypothetical protein BpHYR1_047283, partial [Brachionus plicatilis]